METYSLNPQILPGKPLSEHDHRKVRAALVIAILVAAAIGVAFWISVGSKPVAGPAADEKAQLRSKVAELLRDTPVQSSQADIDRVTSLLSKSKVTATEQDRQAMAEALKN